ncbi:MAG: transposase [FCB group bacterium]|jgi:REP element-mobilizing transposase RayT|nr:transposase [FCB group bacterium]
MTRPRSTLVSLADTPWYHIVNRCVRRAFLCGDDWLTGQNFDHRRAWIVERVKQLASVFAIDVAAYAVMSNHYHLVLRVDAERARSWSRDEVLRRWTQLFDGPVLVQRLQSAKAGGEDAGLDAATLARIDEWAETYRARLMDISWFMRVLNETIARQTNAEDKVTGRFWEGRFKSQALLDDQAILTAMTYVDLNPIRAAMAETPEESEHTSAAERIGEMRPGRGRKKAVRPSKGVQSAAPSSVGREGKRVQPLLPLRIEAHLAQLPQQPLMPFDATGKLGAAIPFSLEDYLELVEATGRCQHPDKRGKMPACAPRLLQRLQLEPEQFVECSAKLLLRFGSAVGAPENLTAHCAARQVKYLRGMGAARRMEEKRTA